MVATSVHVCIGERVTKGVAMLLVSPLESSNCKLVARQNIVHTRQT